MEMRLQLTQSLSQNLDVDGGLTDSCLPEAQDVLEGEQKILMLLRHRLGNTPYRSVMDAVLCGFVPHLKPRCFAFYEDEEGEPRLDELLSEKALTALDKHLANCLRTLRTMYDDIVRQELWAKGRGHDAKAFTEALKRLGWGES